ncbi:zinc finger protein 436-like [Armigeres subalbatus]|uniref:zinc finger protein 436-like n=1 Tax=Armigeres subalbatus TaxID=124917 RepID=UPI002ED18CF8
MDVPLNVDRICRTCLTETGSLICLFDNDPQQSGTISSIISACSNIKIKRNDGLPDKVCRKCLQSARNAFAFKQQCDIAYRTLRTLAEQYNLTVATSEGDSNDTSRGTQTDKVVCCGQRCSVNSGAIDKSVGGNAETQIDQKPEVQVQEEQTPEIADFCESKPNCIRNDSACKLESFENVEYLLDTIEETVPQVKEEPNAEEEVSNLDTDFNSEQVDFLELEFETGKASPDCVPKPKSKKASPGVHKCEYCNKEFRRGTHLRRHILTHTQEKNFNCKICTKAFSRSDHLAIHESTFHSQERPFCCQLCEKSFKRSEHLRNHMETKHNGAANSKKQNFCEVCAKGFASAKNLESHMKTHLQPKVYMCSYCDEQFANKNDQRLHVRQLHLEGKSFLCSECGQSFLRNDYLKVHMRRHKGIKPFKCKFCPKAFPRKTDLRVHEKYHTNEKPHLCTICGKSFHRAYNLVVHSRTHNGLKPYQCPHCPKSFAQGNDLKAHIRRHTGERYRCELCNEGFIQGYQLTNHKRTVHNIEDKGNTRRVTKYLTESAQDHQVSLQKRRQELEQLLKDQEAHEEQQKAGLDIDQTEHDLEQKIMEAKDHIQQIERQLAKCNSHLQEELDRQKQTEIGNLQEDYNKSVRPPNASYGQDFLNDPVSTSVKNEN